MPQSLSKFWYQYKTIMKRNYYSEPQIGFRTYSFVILVDFYTICHRNAMSAESSRARAKKLIHYTSLKCTNSSGIVL